MTGYGTVANMVTLLPIEPLDEAHGMLIVAAFSRHFIINGGKQDGGGDGDGYCSGDGSGFGDGFGYDYGNGDGNGNGDGYGWDYGDGNGSGYGWDDGGKPPEEWIVKP